MPPSANCPIVATTGERDLSRVPDRLIGCATRMTGESGHKLGRGNVPHVDETVLRARNNKIACRTERGADQVAIRVLVAFETANGLACAEIPQPIRVVLRAAEHHAASVIEGDARHLAEMGGECADRDSADQIPEFDRVVLRARDKQIAIEIDVHTADCACVSDERADRLCARLSTDVPQTKNFVVSSTDHMMLIGVHLDTINVAAWASR